MANEKLSIGDVATIFGVGATTIHRWVEKRGFPAQRTLGRRLRFDPSAIRAFLLARGEDVPAELAELARRAG